MLKRFKKLSEDQEIEQEELEIKREYFIFIPLLVLIVAFIAYSAVQDKSRVAVELVQPVSNSGYWIVYDNGEVKNFGTAAPASRIEFANGTKIVTAQPSNQGFWAMNNKGTVFPVLGAQYAGSIDNTYDFDQAVELIPHTSNRAYRIVGDTGPVYAFNTESITGGQDFDKPVAAAVSSELGEGYWLVEPNGSITAFGDAQNYSNLVLTDEEIIDGGPYADGMILLTNRGKVYVVGSGQKAGDLSQEKLSSPLVDIDGMSDGEGYRIMSIDGKISSFGTAKSLQTY